MEIEIIRQSVSKNLDHNDCILRGDIQNLSKNYKIRLKSLSKIAGVDYVWLKDFMEGKNIFRDYFTSIKKFNEQNTVNVNNLDIPNPVALSNIVSVLSYGNINEDERVKAIIDVLIAEFEISYETLAIYADIMVEDVLSFMNDANSISIEKKYKLAVGSLFLHYLFKKSPN